MIAPQIFNPSSDLALNLAQRDKIVLLGLMSCYPVAGVTWQTLHYLIGFQRLGYDVYYVEAHGRSPRMLLEHEKDDAATRAGAYLDQIMRRFGLENHWAYQTVGANPGCLGMSQHQLTELYRSAAVIINLHGSHLPTPELTAGNRLVFLETDPVGVQIQVSQKDQECLEYLAPHCAFFTYGENIGQPDCLVPVPEPFRFLHTRQPVVMDFWEDYGRDDAAVFTTVGNWRQFARDVKFRGEVYRWSKHFEFQKIIDLPRRVSQPFELALSSGSYAAADRQLLESKGWRIRDALDFSRDLDKYRQYIGHSRGEFTVAKDQNVRLRSGWFSDRAVTYLAAGRPVITQETGFSNFLPTGEGLFSFTDLEGIVEAVETVNADYGRQARTAAAIARAFFSHDVVLGQFIDDLGLSKPRKPKSAAKPAIPSGLVLSPLGRWPTRLPEATLSAALALPAPVTSSERSKTPRNAPVNGTSEEAKRASIVVVTHNGLPFTKMCFSSLFDSTWEPGDELIVVDNASTDGTRDYLEDLQRSNSCVKVLLNGSNRGFAPANNQGLAAATGDLFILLNNDTLVPPNWRERLTRWLDDAAIGLVGPVTNRTCNEAQIDAPYHTYGEMEQFAQDYINKRGHQAIDLDMLAMFCLAMRRETHECVGPLDEQFELGMFEDDDYALRVRQCGWRVVCAEDVFVHHFGQASFGHLRAAGEYDRVFRANRHRFELKWGRPWQPPRRRVSPEYIDLRTRIRDMASRELPNGSVLAVISMGDEELLRLNGHRAWHFPQEQDGSHSSSYPADGAEAIAHLEKLRARGAAFLLIPKPALWWLEHYSAFKAHLDCRCRPVIRDEESCFVFDLNAPHP